MSWAVTTALHEPPKLFDTSYSALPRCVAYLEAFAASSSQHAWHHHSRSADLLGTPCLPICICRHVPFCVYLPPRQFLGYFEVMRREGPRERSFLQASC